MSRRLHQTEMETQRTLTITYLKKTIPLLQSIYPNPFPYPSFPPFWQYSLSILIMSKSFATCSPAGRTSTASPEPANSTSRESCARTTAARGTWRGWCISLISLCLFYFILFSYEVLPDGGQRKTRDKQRSALKALQTSTTGHTIWSSKARPARRGPILLKSCRMLPLKMLRKTQFKDNLIGESFESKAQALAQQTAAENELKLEEAAFSFFAWNS